MRLTDAEKLFGAIGDKEDDIAKAKDRAAGSWVTYYEGVADGLLLAKGLIAEEKTIEIYQNKPEIDPVHAAGGVYCRECKDFDEYAKTGIFGGNCMRTNALRFANDFCSWGIKKGAEDDG
nr:MAG TPA: hypothetical protein [Caudoviricetes sp.]